MAVVLVAFCTICQRVTAHRLVYQGDGVVGARCPDCGNVIARKK